MSVNSELKATKIIAQRKKSLIQKGFLGGGGAAIDKWNKYVKCNYVCEAIVKLNVGLGLLWSSHWI